MNWLPPAASAFAIAGGLFEVYRWSSDRGIKLDRVITNMIAASAIPTGLLLIASAFDTSLLRYESDAGVYLAAAGMALLYVSLKELAKQIATDPSFKPSSG